MHTQSFLLRLAIRSSAEQTAVWRADEQVAGVTSVWYCHLRSPGHPMPLSPAFPGCLPVTSVQQLRTFRIPVSAARARHARLDPRPSASASVR